MNHYVCDKCGNYFEAYRSSSCPACTSESLREFPQNRKQAALAHAANIRMFEPGFDPARSSYNRGAS